MILRSLTTQSFRNLGADEVAFHDQVNIVVGRNGQGKTNLLEAIYFLATTKSFRTARIGERVPVRIAERLRLRACCTASASTRRSPSGWRPARRGAARC